MFFEKLAVRACFWAGLGTLLAIAANTAFGDRENLVLASFVGAVIGSCLGWIVVQEQARLQGEANAADEDQKLLRPRSFR